VEPKRRRARAMFEATFAFFLCLTLYGLVMLGSVWAPIFLGGPKLKPLVAYILMPMDLVMLGWNQKWPVLTLHLASTAVAYYVSKNSAPKMYDLMIFAFAGCALVAAVNDAIKAYRHPPKAKVDAKAS
jgi:hypothetical protein